MKVIKKPAMLRAPHRKLEYIMFMQKSCNKLQASLLSVKKKTDMTEKINEEIRATLKRYDGIEKYNH